MTRPGVIKPPKKPPNSTSSNNASPGGVKPGISNINNQMKEYTEQMQSSRGLITNVLDLDDDYLQLHAIRGCSDCNCYTHLNNFQTSHNHFQHQHQHSHSTNCTIDSDPAPGLPPMCPLNDSPTGAPLGCQFSAHSKDISAIFKELRFITNRMRRDDEMDDIIQGMTLMSEKWTPRLTISLTIQNGSLLLWSWIGSA